MQLMGMNFRKSTFGLMTTNLLSKTKNQGYFNLLTNTLLSGCELKMKAILTRFRMDLEVKDGSGRTILSLAVLQNSGKVVRLLLNSGSDVNTSDNDGNTPLHISLRCFFMPITEMLLEAGADETALN